MKNKNLSDLPLFNRELGVLAFNERVLAQAADPAIPLLERLRFLCIVSSNLDEFFEIRVSGLLEQMRSDPSYREVDGLAASEVIAEVRHRTSELVARQYTLLNDTILPALEKTGVSIYLRPHLTGEMDTWAHQYFEEQILPVLTPIGLDPAHPFPRILNKSLNIVVELSGTDAFGRAAELAIVQAPRVLPRVIALPEKKFGRDKYVLLSSILMHHVGELFPGIEVRGAYAFRVTRNSDLFVDEEEMTNLRQALQGELTQRHFGDAVRLEVGGDCPDSVVQFLLRQFEIGESELFRVDGPVNLARLMQVADTCERADLKYGSFLPAQSGLLADVPDVFEVIRQGDILLHHPFESFEPVIDYLRAAAHDSDVVAIKQTIYRTGSESELMELLIAAAKSGKEVTAVVELMARFDEETNINWAGRLEAVGAHVVYGVVGHKTHAKMCLVVRREGGRLRRYVHLGTGNYHPRTARFYTDFGLITANEQLCDDANEVFRQLTGLSKVRKLHHIWQSPFTLHQSVLDSVAREIKNAKDGKKARIIAKMNALLEPRVINALYSASAAGVKVDLIVRGACALVPGRPGLSDNIRVVSAVGRFLEHSRIYWFENAGNPEVRLSSADWMDRNFFRRVEISFPMLDAKFKKRIYSEGLAPYLRKDAGVWELDFTGQYKRQSSDEPTAQQRLLSSLVKAVEPERLKLKGIRSALRRKRK